MATNVEQPGSPDAAQTRTTPPPRPAPLEKLQSTPGQGKGSASAAVSDSFRTFQYVATFVTCHCLTASHNRVGEVVPKISADLQRHQQCDFKTMLVVLLKRVVNLGVDLNGDALLDECLEAVLGICNDPGPKSLKADLAE